MIVVHDFCKILIAETGFHLQTIAQPLCWCFRTL